ncbi:MAG: hypothetical protein OXH15_02240 [Gammaproteobacteria bacterium]|nr:hypothetical protein [Gammaproteobacteria bacterium]
MTRLRSLGADAVPVVADGTRWVPGVDLGQVAKLLEVDYEATPALSPDVLIDRLRHALATSKRLTAQFPAANLGDRLPNRDRTNLALANHIVEIAAGYVKVAAGAEFDHGVSAAIPEPEVGPEALAARSDAVVSALLGGSPVFPGDEVATFFGSSTLHAVLERCTWHVVQHVRQQAMLLEGLGVAPDGPLATEDFDGLPLPSGVWDG